MTMVDEVKGTLRPASVEDAPGVTAFLADLGLVMPKGPDEVIRHWRGLWKDNPALMHHRDDVSLGSVLEEDGVIKGFFGNIPQVAWMGERKILVSSARAWAVDAAYRTETQRLCQFFFDQEGIDLAVISSASPPAGRRCEAFGADRMPQPNYSDILYWIVDAPGFLRAAFRKKGRGANMSWLLGMLSSVPLDFSMRLRGRRPYGILDNVTPVPLSAIDTQFDALWMRNRKARADTLLMTRDAATLQWYFDLGNGRDQTRVLRYDRGDTLLGYAVLVREDAPAIGLKRLKVADLFVDDDDPAVIRSLLAGAYEYAMAKRCHVLELVGLPPKTRDHVLAHKPFSRPMPTFPFFYKALAPDLGEQLASADTWYVSAYDGDTALL
jgi:hypothetical protein